MAYNLKAIFSIQDNITAKLRRITQDVEKLNRAMRQVGGSSDAFSRSQRQVNSAVNNTNNTFIRNTSTVNNNTNAVINNVTQINRYSSAASRMTSSINSQSSAVSGLKSHLLGIGATYLSVQGLASGFGNFTEAADSYSNISARLANVNDGLQTQAQLQDKIFKASQRSRSSYDVMASSVAKLNLLAKDAFSSNNEAIKFTELMTKSFAVSGAGAQEMESGMYQLTQAMAAGKLQGDEFRSIMENAPLLAQAISKTAGVSMGELKKMSSEGTITADLIKKSLFNAADEIEEKFGKMPMTFSQAMTLFKSSAKRVFEPLFNQFISFVNSKTFEKLESKALSFVQKTANGLSRVFSSVKSLYKVWESISPVVTKVAKVIGTFVSVVGGIFAIIGAVKLVGAAFAFIASPIGLIAAGVTGLILGFKSLYNNSEKFRGVIDGIKNKAAELYEAFKSRGTSGLIDSLFPPDTAAKINAFVDGIKAKASELMTAFENGGVMGVLSSLLPPGVVEEITSFVSGIKSAFTSVKDYISAKITELQPTFAMFGEAFNNIKNIATTALTTLWSVAGPILSTFWNGLQILGDIAVMVFNNVLAPAFQMVTTALSALWSIVGPILELLGAMLKVVGEVVLWLWDVAFKPFFSYVTSGMSQLSEKVMPVLDTLKSVFESIGSAISKAAGYVKDFASKLGSVKIPDWMGKVGGGVMNFVSKVIPNGSHYNGAWEIARNGYIAELHKGETVLPRAEADFYRSLVGNPSNSLSQVVGTGGSLGGGSGVDNVSFEQASAGITYNTTTNNHSTVNNGGRESKGERVVTISPTINMPGMVVREEADIRKIADQLVSGILEKRAVFG